MYQFHSKIRYSEVDADCKLTIAGLLNYFQDCTVFHSESLNVGIEHLAKEHCAWILTFWQIKVNRLPKLAEEVQIQTWPYEMKSFLGQRNFQMLDEKQNPLAQANSVWALMNLEKMRPVKVPDEITNTYGLEAPLAMEYCDRRIELPEDLEDVASVVVPSYFIDSNHHMNNEKYVTIAAEFVPSDFQIAELRVEYKKQAMLGDEIFCKVKKTDTQITVALLDEKEKPYAIVAFLG